MVYCVSQGTCVWGNTGGGGGPEAGLQPGLSKCRQNRDVHVSCDICWDIKAEFSIRSSQTLLSSWHVADITGATDAVDC
jgi:hypothetical protein